MQREFDEFQGIFEQARQRFRPFVWQNVGEEKRVHRHAIVWLRRKQTLLPQEACNENQAEIGPSEILALIYHDSLTGRETLLTWSMAPGTGAINFHALMERGWGSVVILANTSLRSLRRDISSCLESY